MVKKPNFPSKTCPGCGALIHARSKSHPACGWVMENGVSAAKAPAKPKNGRRKKHVPATVPSSEISLQDIIAVKKVVDQLGAEKVQQLAKVLMK
jgi:hypothetical protein